jgi:hypothetical protein
LTGKIERRFETGWFCNGADVVLNEEYINKGGVKKKELSCNE